MACEECENYSNEFKNVNGTWLCEGAAALFD
jgi:hypothetical protein